MHLLFFFKEKSHPQHIFLLSATPKDGHKANQILHDHSTFMQTPGRDNGCRDVTIKSVKLNKSTNTWNQSDIRFIILGNNAYIQKQDTSYRQWIIR